MTEANRELELPEPDDAQRLVEDIAAGTQQAPVVDVASDYTAAQSFSVSSIERNHEGVQAAELVAPEVNLPKPEATRVEAQPTGDPDKFRSIAHEVNPISGEKASLDDALMQKVWEKGQPASSNTSSDNVTNSEAPTGAGPVEADTLVRNQVVTSSMTQSPPEPPVDQTTQLKELLAPFRETLEQLLQALGEYKIILITLGGLLVSLPVIVFVVTLLKTINAFPLVAPTFELIGIGYTAWFVYRYLLFAENRQEISSRFNKSFLGKSLAEVQER